MERYELEESREYKVAMVLEDALNNTCFDYKMFAESVKYYHPTPHQSPIAPRLSWGRELSVGEL